MPSNQIQYIRIQHSSSRYKFCIFNAHFFSNIKILKEQNYSQVLELGITFISFSQNMTFEYYRNQPKSVLEWKLFEKTNKNPKPLRVVNRQNCSHPLIRDFVDIDQDEFY